MTRPWVTAPPPLAPAEPVPMSPIVLQALWLEEKVVLESSAYRINAQRSETIPLFVYNFSDQFAEGRLTVTGPAGWKLNLPGTIKLEPDDRKELALEVDVTGQASAAVGTLRITGDFGPAGWPILSIRLQAEPSTISEKGVKRPGALGK